jgi:hypothetical protein
VALPSDRVAYDEFVRALHGALLQDDRSLISDAAEGGVLSLHGLCDHKFWPLGFAELFLDSSTRLWTWRRTTSCARGCA